MVWLRVQWSSWHVWTRVLEEAVKSAWQVCLHRQWIKAWRLLFSSVEALKPLIKLSLIISYGDEYRIDHGQKTVQPGAPAGERRRDEESYTQCKQCPCHSLPDNCPCYYARRRQEKWWRRLWMLSLLLSHQLCQLPWQQESFIPNRGWRKRASFASAHRGSMFVDSWTFSALTK